MSRPRFRQVRDLSIVRSHELRTSAYIPLDVIGGDNLAITCPILFGEFGSKSLEAFGHFRKDVYRERFGWIDNFVRAGDPDLISELDGRLGEALSVGSSGNAFLTPGGRAGPAEGSDRRQGWRG